jgi:hypothetical protein
MRPQIKHVEHMDISHVSKKLLEIYQGILSKINLNTN